MEDILYCESCKQILMDYYCVNCCSPREGFTLEALKKKEQQEFRTNMLMDAIRNLKRKHCIHELEGMLVFQCSSINNIKGPNDEEECNCGANEYNKIIDEILKTLEGWY